MTAWLSVEGMLKYAHRAFQQSLRDLLAPNNKQKTFISSAQGTLSKIDHMLGHETSLLPYVAVSKYITSMYIEILSPDNIIIFFYNHETYVKKLKNKHNLFCFPKCLPFLSFLFISKVPSFPLVSFPSA